MQVFRRNLIWPLACFIFIAGRTFASESANGEYGSELCQRGAAGGSDRKTIYGDEHKNRYLLETTGCGAAFFDYDNDGWQDVFLVNGTRLDGTAERPDADQPSLSQQRRWDIRRCHSEGRPHAHGLGTGRLRRAIIDNDGYDDIFVSYFGKNALYRNNGNGTFTDVAEKAGVANNRTRMGIGLRVCRL